MKITTNHDEIKSWAEQHGAIPEIIDHKDARHDRVGIRLKFPGENDTQLLSDTNPPQKVSWEDFFNVFEEQELQFAYNEKEEFGSTDSSYRFENRE